MNKRAVMMMVVVLALIALALPIASMRSRAAGSGSPKVASPKATPVSATAPASAQQERSADTGNQYSSFAKRSKQAQGADPGFQPLSPDIVNAMGIGRQAGAQRAAKKKQQD